MLFFLSNVSQYIKMKCLQQDDGDVALWCFIVCNTQRPLAGEVASKKWTVVHYKKTTL